ncbi:MAG: Bro-N domain-containing protein [Candidatus Falkowbacteria bacterium]|nr:Bro-N domain-containing protein [Candidatus Falkowbacteria bacterium]
MSNDLSSQNINNHIAIFKGVSIRKIIYKYEWWFSVLDVIKILSNSPQPKTYWAKMKKRDRELSQPFPFWEQLKMQAEDGRMRETDCANTEGVLRIVQSIPSPKAEPFKRWLARVGYERIKEVEDPELATKRTRLLYKLKGYPDDWIEKRMRGIAVREELTDEWREKSTTEIHRVEDSKGMIKLKNDAKAGGKIAGDARRQLEKRLGRSVVSKSNYLESGRRKIKSVK